jgi:glucokinase
MSTRLRLLADIGGTNARFAWQDAPGAPLRCIEVLPCQDHAGLAEAAMFWLQKNHLPMPESAALAVACPVQSDHVQLTNSHWSFFIQALKAQLGLKQLAVVNDFTALALALPSIAPGYLRQIGGRVEQPFTRRAPVALLGAGTGLGVSGLLPDSRGAWLPLSGEGGHVSLALHDETQHRIWSVLQQRYGHVSAERVLSGQGIVNIYASLLHTGRSPAPDWDLNPSAVTALALEQGDPTARQALLQFCRWLGGAAGDLALTLGATGGVFIGGGIAPRLGTFLDESGFREAFEDKGRFAAYLQPVPVWVIDTPSSAALQGVATLLD